MKNSDYWKLRFKQLEAAQNGQGAAAVAEIERQYKEAQKQIEGQIARWYQRFADNNGISLAQARQYLKGADLKELKWDVQDYIKYGQDNALNGQWVKQLENASAKYHISKLEALKIQTQQSLEVMFSKQLGTVTGTMGDVFESGYYHTAYELQKGFNIGWDIAGLDQSQIEKVLVKPWAADGYNFSERIWKNKNKLISEVHNELTQNILLGADPQKAIDSLAKKMNTSKYNAGRLVMTEEAYFSSAAQKDCFNDLDVEEYEIVATLDSHTSEICQNMDGKHFPMSEYKAGVTAPPFHVFCRSTTVPYFDENFGDIGERAARGKDSKTYYVPDNITYPEWKKGFVDGDKSGFVSREEREEQERKDKGQELVKDFWEKTSNSDKTSVDKSDESGIIDLYKGNGLSVISDSEIDDKTIEAVTEATKKVTSDFRIIEKYSEPIRFSDVVGGLAENVYRPDTGLNIISLDKRSFSNPSELLEILKNDFALGKSYETDTIQSLVAHEMGHNIHVAFALRRAKLDYGKPLSNIEYMLFQTEYDKIKQEIYLAAFTDENYEEIQHQCARELGFITVGNPQELIAQSFGNYYYGNIKSRIGEQIVKYLMKGLK